MTTLIELEKIDMMASVRIPDELAARVEEAISSGRFKNKSELYRQALESLLASDPAEPVPPPDHEERMELHDLSAETTKKAVRKRKKSDVETRAKHYGPDHYRFTPEIWKEIQDGKLPENERYDTLIVGAYLLAMESKHKIVKQLRGTEFQGKNGRNVKLLLDYFVALKGGDELAGFKETLAYVKWFVTTDDEWIEGTGYSLDAMLAAASYREKYAAKPRKRNKSKGFLANSEGVPYVANEEERIVPGKSVAM